MSVFATAGSLLRRIDTSVALTTVRKEVQTLPPAVFKRFLPKPALADGAPGRNLVKRSFTKSHAVLFEIPRSAEFLLRPTHCAAHNNFPCDQRWWAGGSRCRRLRSPPR